jgi:formate hydrogenlyase subunit 6/NADH:ubiquinone oxidoreductase subunit I
MTKMALKWALKKPVTKQYPFVPRVPMPGARGQLEFTKDNCTYCTVCGKKCPTKAIVVNRQAKKWTLDRLLCISCNACVEICPKDCLQLNGHHGTVVVTKDKEIHG